MTKCLFHGFIAISLFTTLIRRSDREMIREGGRSSKARIALVIGNGSRCRMRIQTRELVREKAATKPCAVHIGDRLSVIPSAPGGLSREDPCGSSRGRDNSALDGQLPPSRQILFSGHHLMVSNW